MKGQIESGLAGGFGRLSALSPAVSGAGPSAISSTT